MLHRDTLVRLCRARDRLRETGEARRSVRQVAAEAGMSQYHFIRLFKAVFGETPKQCQVRARLAEAKRLLTLTEARVTDICMEVGFSSLGSFSAAFASRVGRAPSAYRETVQDLVRVPGVMPAELTPGCLTLMSRMPG